MKTIALLLFVFGFSIGGFAQVNPIKWSYTTKKVSDKTYELCITATMNNGWHVYSQKQPRDAIAPPTVIKFNKNPLLNFEGNAKETGKLEKKKEPITDTEAWQYAKQVEFVQTLKLKANIKTTIQGTIEYMVCTDEMCLPLKTILFNVKLE